MKVNQIVGEHKKGVRAKIYNKKGPEPRKVSKQPPPAGIATAFAEDAAQQVYKVTKSDPNTGLELTKPDGTKLVLPPDKMNAIAANPNDPNKYLLNPDAITQQATSGQPSGPEIGREVEVNTAETDNPEQSAFEDQDEQGDVGGDATDAYIDSIVDTDFEKAQGRLRELAGIAPAQGEAPAPQAGEVPMPGQNMPPEVLNLDDVDAKTLDSAEGFKAVITKAAGSAGVEGDVTQQVTKMVAAAPDGSVDMDKTLTNMMAGFSDFADELAKMIQDIITAYETAMKHPDYALLTPAEKQSVVEALQELKAKLPEMQKHAQAVRAQSQAYQANQAQLAQRPAAPRPEAGVQEAKELEAMLRIAGLR